MPALANLLARAEIGAYEQFGLDHSLNPNIELLNEPRRRLDEDTVEPCASNTSARAVWRFNPFGVLVTVVQKVTVANSLSLSGLSLLASCKPLD